jgi:uncharacterized repeat protein (TIGR03837 family)
MTGASADVRTDVRAGIEVQARAGVRRALRCDIFCRVVDNLGDAAVCWRLARQLAAEHGWHPRLWIDTPTVLSKLVPGTRPGRMHQGVRIEHWREQDARLSATAPTQVPEVVIAAFACDLPAGYRKAMRPAHVVWLNLEYLSAEAWVDAHHGLPSPKPQGGLEHFFFPGFSVGSGGLLREADLLARRDAFCADPWARQAFLSGLGLTPQPGDRWASMFCYPRAPVDAILEALHRDTSGGRWRVLVPAGVEIGQVRPDLRETLITLIPFVPQHDYDRLLWSCDLNWVRGEDSLVRALWSGRPFLWQAYPQHDNAHLAKLHALIEQWTATARPDPAVAQVWCQAMQAWNLDPATGDSPTEAMPALLRSLPALQDAARRWSQVQGQHPDLASRLVAFVGERL